MRWYPLIDQRKKALGLKHEKKQRERCSRVFRHCIAQLLSDLPAGVEYFNKKNPDFNQVCELGRLSPEGVMKLIHECRNRGEKIPKKIIQQIRDS